MFYHILLLQTIIYATNKRECACNTENDESTQTNLNTCDINHINILAGDIEWNNIIHREIYKQIVQIFVEEHIKRMKLATFPRIFNKYEFSINYEQDEIKNLCNDIKEAYGYTNNDAYFDFYLKIFIESAEFSLNTIKTVYEGPQKYNKNDSEYRKASEANSALFDNFIISINWLNSLIGSDYEMCLLYNYNYILTVKNNNSKNKFYTIRCIYTSITMDDENIITNLVKHIQQYYKENDFTNKEKIIENESREKIRDWVDNKNDIQDKERYKTMMEDAIRHIKLYRSMQTKINYLSKPNYGNYKVIMKQKYNFTDKQMEFIEKLQLDSIVKDIYNMKFNTLRMHTDETIMEGIALITTFEENINQLIVFTKHIDQLLTNCIKEKLKTAIQKSKIIPKNTKEIYMIKIDKIANDLLRDTETNLIKTQETIEETNRYDVFCNTLIDSISNLDLIHKDELKRQTQIIKNENEEINALYNTLITYMNGIIDKKQKLDEKRTEIEKTKQYIENHVRITKGIMEGIEAGTLKEKAAVKSKKTYDWCQDIAFSFLDEIIETKGMIVQTEALVCEILKELNLKGYSLLFQ